jgi:hypothetical protein
MKDASHRIYAMYLSQSHMDVCFSPKNAPQRIGDAVRLKACRGYLVKQRLKCVVVVPV